MAAAFIPGVQFVAQDPNTGQFYSFYDGQPHFFGSQAEAEQDYNSRFPDTAPATAPATAPSTAPTSSPYGGQVDAYNSYLQAVTQSNREQFQAQVDQQQRILDFDKQKWSESIGWEKERWAQQYAQDQQKFDEMKRQFDVQIAATEKQGQQSLAINLLQGATQLQRPESWLDYSTYTQGGRNIFESLYGSQPAPAFGAPTGYSAPLGMEKLLASMGLSNAPGMQEALARSTGAVTGGITTQGAQAQPNVPLPHQINPAVWDASSDTAKRMILGAAQKGFTPSGVWTAEDFLNQLNASRPQGLAPKQISYDWQQPQSYF